MRTTIFALAMIASLASFNAKALVVEDTSQELSLYLTSQRWFSTPPATNISRNGTNYQDSLSWVRTDERNQVASAAAERNATVLGDSITITGSTQSLATHGDAFGSSGPCWCITESWVRVWSEFFFTVDERSSYILDWDLIEQAMLPGSENTVSIVLQSMDPSPEHPVDVQYSALEDFNAVGTIDSGSYYLSVRVSSGTNLDWLSFPSASSTGANTSFALSFSTTPAPVPLPASVWLLLSGLSACGIVFRKEKVTRQLFVYG